MGMASSSGAASRALSHTSYIFKVTPPAAVATAFVAWTMGVLANVAAMAEIVFPSLDLTPLAGKGVLLRLKPKGPIVTAKGIAAKGVFFESQKKLDLPSSCNITLVFFDSSNPLTVKGGIIWQTQIRGSSAYNIGFKFLSLEPSQSRRINEYINNARKVICELNKQSDITTCGGI